MVQQRRTHTQSRLAPHLNDLWLPSSVPILERRIQIAFKEINRRQKFIGVCVLGIKLQRAKEIMPGLSIFLLLERHASEFDGKARIVRSQSPTIRERLASLVP